MNRYNAICLMHQAKKMTPEELDGTYGIFINDDGTVWDNVEGREFDSLYAWVEFAAEQEEASDTFHKFGGNHWYDDD